MSIGETEFNMRRGLLEATYNLVQTIHANQLIINGKLNLLLKQEANMAIDLSTITAEVTNNTSVTQSVLTLVQNLAQQIAAIPPSNDPVTQAALDALTATLATNDTAIAAAVTANTLPTPAP